MEATIKKFISGYGSGSGDGYDDGSGSGDGYDDGSGFGYDDGFGYGSGSGYNDGSGFGYDDGFGFGYDDGFGSGFKIKTLAKSKVYYIDGIPCTFNSVHENWACINVISKKDFTTQKAFVAKDGCYFAHGDTIRMAFESLKEKIFSSKSFEEKKKELLKKFKEEKKLSVKELCVWHGLLTGSCEFGRKRFVESLQLKDDDYFTLEDFISLTKDSYGGDKIKQLLNNY